MKVTDLFTTLLNAEKQLQTRLRTRDHPGLSVWSRQVLAHALQSSERVSSSLAALARDLAIDPRIGHVAYSTERFLRRIAIHPGYTPQSTEDKQHQDFESAASLLRCTKLRTLISYSFGWP